METSYKPSEYAEKIAGLFTWHGRNAAPRILFNEWENATLEWEAHPYLLEWAWTCAEYPLQCIEDCDWIEMFEWVGYHGNGQRLKRPEGTVRLYRGTTIEHAPLLPGMSWTTSRETAEWFATRYAHQRDTACILEMDAPFEIILANYDNPGHRSESEMVIHPDLVGEYDVEIKVTPISNL